MPTYEYACKSCGEHIEVVQSFSDDPLTTCPSCGGDLRKVFGSIGVVLKGSGFYRTDNRGSAPREPKGKRDKKDASKDSKPEVASQGSGDAKASKESKPSSAASPASAAAKGTKSA